MAKLTRKPDDHRSREAVLSWNCRPMLGSATFTMVMSMMAMNMAATKTTLTAIFWLSWIRGFTGLVLVVVVRRVAGSSRVAGCCGCDLMLRCDSMLRT